MSKVYTEAELHSLKLTELKALCKELKLKPTGTKAELIQRIAGIFLSSGSIAPDKHEDDNEDNAKDKKRGKGSKKKKNKNSEDNGSPPISPPPSPKRIRVYPPGYVEFMNQMKYDNYSMLKSLGFNESDLSNHMLDLANIENMDRGINPMTKEQLLLAVKSTKSLKIIFLLAISSLDDPTLEAIVQHCPSLQFISLRECAQISDTGVASLVTSCKKSLIGLDLTYCLNVTNTGIQGILNECSSLRYLRLTCLRKISDECLVDISTKCPNIEFVEGLEDQFTDKALRQLAKCPNLKSIDCNNRSYTITGINYVRDMNPDIELRNLETLNADHEENSANNPKNIHKPKTALSAGSGQFKDQNRLRVSDGLEIQKSDLAPIPNLLTSSTDYLSSIFNLSGSGGLGSIGLTASGSLVGLNSSGGLTAAIESATAAAASNPLNSNVPISASLNNLLSAPLSSSLDDLAHLASSTSRSSTGNDAKDLQLPPIKIPNGTAPASTTSTNTSTTTTSATTLPTEEKKK